MTHVRFDANYEETKLIFDIVTRAAKEHSWLLTNTDFQCLLMDLDACHSNGCPLDFEKLLAFPDFDFVHDLSGIHRHINRDTGELEDCFLPRCAQKSPRGGDHETQDDPRDRRSVDR